MLEKTDQSYYFKVINSGNITQTLLANTTANVTSPNGQTITKTATLVTPSLGRLDLRSYELASPGEYKLIIAIPTLGTTINDSFTVLARPKPQEIPVTLGRSTVLNVSIPNTSLVGKALTFYTKSVSTFSKTGTVSLVGNTAQITFTPQQKGAAYLTVNGSKTNEFVFL